ncbi:beta-glucoside-specific PTS transporter subunit IIABC [Klebsiella quasipneumoniae]|uniref:beta-glucoside-specific PTS transporter subunit IIABC n=2 Tax=Klebsiella quasipneumoniae TaxID=1463165 RepID=UPI0015DC3EB8|nr:PTS glucose transporter subunit IIA [Klebsiella quasipneumoniae]HCI4636870.1 PTS glucose transporter subunit IIA [Klebsiella quasipneumoniae subsp. quasipneumoniae]EMF1932830.1 PTS glucose transporter subunit IIA [Klebsiella quasipneumoniae]BBR83351.1 PTS beta-glucoside transporter subunit EIIBCA [Klebsiella quasipneumoniae]HCI6168913.1 PTS glucose transporter subunit IIA [Klebsiella quasipneumoniae subsp. quasipneumoniae]
MDHLNTGRTILKLVGGAGNIEHIEHCSTRLRLSLYDNSKVEVSDLKKLPEVMGVVTNVQCQIVIGKDVVKVFDAIRSLMANDADAKQKPVTKKKWNAWLIDFVISIFQPLIPAIAGGGVLKSILIILNMAGWLTKDSSTYQILDCIGTAPIYFLPLLIAITTANKLKVNPLVALTAVSVLLLPTFTTLAKQGATLMTFDITNVSYAAQVFPAILCVIFYAQTESLFNRYTPNALRGFLSPMLSLVTTVPVTLLILGPLGFEMGSLLTHLILWMHGKFGFIATGLLAGGLPFIVAAGMHKPFLPYAIMSMGQTGKESLYNPASLAHNIAEAGACLAVSLKSKDKMFKGTALSSGISALFGITEPALYGITLLHRPVLISVMLGAMVGGSFMGFMMVSAYAIVAPSLASISIFASPDNPTSLIYAIIGALVSFCLAFLSTLFFWKEKTTTPHPVDEMTKFEKTEVTANPVLMNDFTFTSPVEGKVIPLTDVNDDVFSSKIMGDGIAIVPTVGALYAPADGVIEHVFESGHAASMMTTHGVEVIFHIGIDTIQMNGQGFHPKITDGQRVKAGELLIEFDIDEITKAGYDPVVIMVITNSDRFMMKPSNDHTNTLQQFNIFSLKEA